MFYLMLVRVKIIAKFELQLRRKNQFERKIGGEFDANEFDEFSDHYVSNYAHKFDEF